MNNNHGLFIYLLALTAFFFLFEIGFFLQFKSIYLGNLNLVAHHLHLPASIIPGMLYFVLAQFIVHLGFTLFIWIFARWIGAVFQLSWQKTTQFGFLLWILGVISVLLLNQILFPNSEFATLMNILFNQTIATIFLGIILSFFGMIMMACVWKQPILSCQLLVIGIVIVGGFFLLHSRSLVMKDAATPEHPNIILIGIDSLRPDFLSYFGSQQHTPHLDEFLNHATVFAEALTPLARTFPAWVSILTGEYPNKNGIRTNLSDQQHLDLRASLPMVLRARGYQTLFATDETRFSNIDEHFGFDAVIEPPIGVNEFLLGSLNDFPLTNLLINTPIGRKLFPNSYANRPAHATYDPNSFLDLINGFLKKPREKPLFLAVHFCLPHYPYIWSSFQASNQPLQNYAASVARVDQQFDDFFNLLQKNKLLEHSIVVLLSDHGEALELTGDRITDPDLFISGIANPKKMIPHFYPAGLNAEEVNQSVGHGTDVLGLTQYHIVLAFRLFGLSANQKNLLPGYVSLLDIKPTIFSLLKIQPVLGSGHSLQQFILEKKSLAVTQSDFFIESDFSPPAVRSVHPETRKLLFEGVDYFQIDAKTSRVTVKKNMLDFIISSKQYADFHGDWVLALYPQDKKIMLPILVNLKTGQWTNDLSTSFAAKSPANPMLQALRNFYEKDLKNKEISAIPVG